MAFEMLYASINNLKYNYHNLMTTQEKHCIWDYIVSLTYRHTLADINIKSQSLPLAIYIYYKQHCVK